MKLKPEKCEFLRKEGNYLGHVISENGASPVQAKTRVIGEYPPPRT